MPASPPSTVLPAQTPFNPGAPTSSSSLPVSPFIADRLDQSGERNVLKILLEVFMDTVESIKIEQDDLGKVFRYSCFQSKARHWVDVIQYHFRTLDLLVDLIGLYISMRLWLTMVL